MTTRLKAQLAILLAAMALLTGCATTRGTQDELPTSSDQTDNQKRARIRLQLGISYYEQRQYPTALDEIKQALLADPGLADAYSVRALVYMDMGETRLAEENFQRAMQLSPNNPELSNNYGWFLCQNGRPKESLQYFEAALKNRSYQSPAKALNNAGACSLKLKESVSAERYFVRAFQLDPGNPAVNANLAKVYFERHDYDRAHFYINRVIKADVMTADALWLAIRIEHKLGDRAAELGLVTQLRKRYPESPEFVLYQRGAFDE